jgi:hypothetical protein
MEALCAECGKPVPNDDHYAYDGKAYHFRCLPPEAKEVTR